MTKQEFSNYVEEAIAHFEDPLMLEKKFENFAKQAKIDEEFKPHIAVLADSRIMMSPEFIFAQGLGVTCSIQSILRDDICETLVANVEFSIEIMGCKHFIIALHREKNTEIEDSKCFIEHIVNSLETKSSKFKSLVEKGDSMILGCLVDMKEMRVTPIKLDHDASKH